MQRLGLNETFDIVAPVCLARSGYTTRNLDIHVKRNHRFTMDVYNKPIVKYLFIEPRLVQRALAYRQNKKTVKIKT
jgi:hypothetical protein